MVSGRAPISGRALGVEWGPVIPTGDTVMEVSIQDTGAFDAAALNLARCPGCGGTGELRIDSENINENFEVEKQTVITPCDRCGATGFIRAG